MQARRATLFARGNAGVTGSDTGSIIGVGHVDTPMGVCYSSNDMSDESDFAKSLTTQISCL